MVTDRLDMTLAVDWAVRSQQTNKHYTTLHYTALHCNAMQRNATQRNAKQRNATQRKARQHGTTLHYTLHLYTTLPYTTLCLDIFKNNLYLFSWVHQLIDQWRIKVGPSTFIFGSRVRWDDRKFPWVTIHIRLYSIIYKTVLQLFTLFYAW